MAVPPKTRQKTNHSKLEASALPSEVTTKRIAAAQRSHLRPRRSVSIPPPIEPSRHPSSARLLIQPGTEAVLRDLEERLKERFRSADHHPVVAEEQSAPARVATSEIVQM